MAPFPEVAAHNELTGVERQCPHCASEMRETGQRRPATNWFASAGSQRYQKGGQYRSHSFLTALRHRAF